MTADAGQGELPQVPERLVPCDNCNKMLHLVQGKLPVRCPHCGYHLRPGSESIWGHFLFVLKHRYISWRGRSTRKEYWSFTLISFLFLLFLSIPFILADEDDMNLFSISLMMLIVLSGYFFLIALPQIFLIARRLHDIGLSAVSVIIHLVLTIITFVVMIVAICVEYSNEQCDDAIYPDDDKEFLCLDTPEDDFSPGVAPYVYLATACNIAAEGLQFFFFIVCFLISQPGTNRFGTSRKYPIAT